NIEKACDIVLTDNLDLKQVYENKDPDLSIEEEVSIGVARRFISDVSDWIKYF
ncbi:hypothetical protein BO85DRAFT_385740, partial [Aspergillus piperis CBS 112811]